MKNFKKALIVVLLVLSIICVLFACTDNSSDQNGENNQNATDNSGEGTTNDGTTDDGANSGDNVGDGGNNTDTTTQPNGEKKNVLIFELITGTQTYYLKSVYLFNGIVDIPATHNDLPVVKIAPQVFYSNEVVEEVNLPDTMEEIGERAFSLCVNLKKVNISASSQLKSIGDRAFFQCENLNTFRLPGELTTVGEEAFSGCLDLVSFDFPASLIKVGAYAFHSGWLNTITEPGMVYVGKVAYTYIPSTEDFTEKEVTLKDDTVAIAGKALYGVDCVSSITIPQSVEYFGSLALNNSGALKTINVHAQNECYSSEGNSLIEKGSTTLLTATPSTVVPAYVTTIGEEAYAYLNGIDTINLPDSVSIIRAGAFKGSSVVSVNIPFDVTVIEEETFLSCEALSSITIHSKIKEIKRAAFNYCTSLETVTVDSETIFDVLDTEFACSGLIARANVIYVKEDLEGQADQLKIGNYKKTETDKSGYIKFVKQ